ncbi:MAG: hypothetical protein FWE80_05655 [Oscillospiraceae bacterium]|nr:hypothetical protein [Oscillospiraceae bacterium]
MRSRQSSPGSGRTGEHRRIAAGFRQAAWSFTARNRRLMTFLALFLGGALAGMLLFLTVYPSLTDSLRAMLSPKPAAAGAGIVRMLISACFSPLILLLILFLTGLSVCGAPAAVAVPFFYGMGLGLSESYFYAAGGRHGIAHTALAVLPPALIAAFALLMASAETLRMSLALGGQLLPGSAEQGGLWPAFRLYLARFTVSAGLIFLSGVVEVLLKMLLPTFL